MLKKEKQTQNKKNQYLRKDSSFNIRDLVMRTPTSSSPNRSPEIYKEEIKARIQKQHLAPKPDQAEILKGGNEKLADVIRYLESFDVGSIQRRSDPRIKELIVRINDTIAEIFGRDTEEYDNHAILSLDSLPITIGGSWYPLPEVREGYQKGIRTAVTKLTSLLDSQKKKLIAITEKKPASPAQKEPIPTPVISGSEKVSLVNLRGKIRSRETILFSHAQPSNGNGRSPTAIIPDSIKQEDTLQRDSHDSSYSQFRADETEISVDQCAIVSATQKPKDQKNVVLLENLEEKLKKLEEEEPVLEEAGHEKVPFSTLMAKLNEIVSQESEYAELHKKETCSNEGTDETLTFDDDHQTSFIVGGEATGVLSLNELGEMNSSLVGADGEVLVIDGDSALSTESNFIETLEADNEAGEEPDGTGFDGQFGNIYKGRKRISLEALEEKLREFEGEEVVEELLIDGDRPDGEEVLFIEDAIDLPEDMLNELAQDIEPVKADENELNNEEVFVIDGDKQLPLKPVSLEFAVENFLLNKPEEMLGEQEVLVIECDNELPEDVSDELPYEENLCESQEEKSPLDITLSETLSQDSDESLDQPENDDRSIIHLFSRAASLDAFVFDSGEDITRAILREDLELRIDDTYSSKNIQEFLYSLQFYENEDDVVLLSQCETLKSNNEKDHVDSSDIIFQQLENSSGIILVEQIFQDLAKVNDEIIQ